MKDEEKYTPLKIIGLIGHDLKNRLEKICVEKQIPLYTLISIALDHELDRKNPFEFDEEDEEFIEGVYSDEAAKILKFMSNISGMTKNTLVTLRHDIGIPDRTAFLGAFRECYLKGFIEAYTPAQSGVAKFKFDINYEFWRLKGTGRKANKKIRKKATEYEMLQKLKKKFGEI